MKEIIKKYESFRRELKAFEYALWLIGWDQETEMPKNALDYKSEQLIVLSEKHYLLSMSKEYLDVVEELNNNAVKLDDDLRIEIKEIHKDLEQMKKIPKDEYLAYQALMSKSSNVWADAREKKDFSLFKNTLEEIVTFQRKLAKYLETDALKGYDVLLDMYEEGMTQKEYDEFFLSLRKEIVPLVKEVTVIKQDFSKFKGLKFDTNKQKEFSAYIMNALNYDLTRGLLKESVHPFTSGVTSSDTRITTKYLETDILSNIFSVIHETGHAIYEQQNDEKYDRTNLHGGTSMGIHESQSRFYENMIGRSYEFWEVHYNKLKEIFSEELKDISVDEFYKFVNKVEKSFIRIEADELTYPLHIMVRYELEKMLISGSLEVKDLPNKWNELMKEYLDITPKDDKEGVLQDIHWSGGSFGYFPTYALGTAYSAQIYNSMNKDLNIKEVILKNDIKQINEWLKEKIHKFAKSKKPKEVLFYATNEEFNAKYFIEYLKNKFKN